MLLLGHVHIHREELVSISWNGQEVTVMFVWPETDLPVLMDVPTDTSLHFDHLAGWGDRSSVQVKGWRAVSQGRTTLLVALALSFTAQRPRLPSIST